jgi:hypothetical protein
VYAHDLPLAHFYSDEGHEPPHVHVRRAEDSCKFWLQPVSLAYTDGVPEHEITRLREVVEEHREEFLRNGMSTLASGIGGARAARAWIDGRKVRVELEDGREIAFPADRFRRLRNATDEQLREVRIEARGRALRWETLDEDLTIDGVLAGHWLP